MSLVPRQHADGYNAEDGGAYESDAKSHGHHGTAILLMLSRLTLSRSGLNVA